MDAPWNNINLLVFIFIIYSFSKLTFNGMASSAPLPKRWLGFFLSNFLSKSLASFVRYGGTNNLAEIILSIVFLRFSAVNGGLKVKQ